MNVRVTLRARVRARLRAVLRAVVNGRERTLVWSMVGCCDGVAVRSVVCVREGAGRSERGVSENCDVEMVLLLSVC